MALSNLKIGTRLYLAFGAVVALLAILVASAQANLSRLGEANGLNIHTYEVLGEASIAGKPDQYRNGPAGLCPDRQGQLAGAAGRGHRSFDQHLQKIRALTADNPTQQERLAVLERTRQQWQVSAIEPVIALRRAAAVDGNLDAVVAAEQAGKGKSAMDAMRVLLADIGKTESMLLAQRGDEAAALKTRTTLVFGRRRRRRPAGGILAMWLTRNITFP